MSADLNLYEEGVLDDVAEIEGVSPGEMEAELAHDAVVSVMQTPPGPLKSSTRLPWTHRPHSGLSEDEDAR
jgi:hypothetical protein